MNFEALEGPKKFIDSLFAIAMHRVMEQKQTSHPYQIMMGPAFFGYLPLGLAPPLLSPAEPRGGLGVYPSALGQRPAQHQHQHASTRFFSPSVDRDRLDVVVVLPNGNIVGRWFLINASD